MRVLRALLALGALSLTACPWDSTKPNPAVGMVVVGGNGQSAIAGSVLPVTPSVKVIDADGNGVRGFNVVWTVFAGAGTITTPVSTTDDEGIASPGSWTLGKVAGVNAVRAAGQDLNAEHNFNATGIAGPAAAIVVHEGANQTAGAGDPVNVRPAVRVVDANENGIAGRQVTFAVTSGGGSVTGGTTNTNFNGIATVGSWTLGAAGGANTLSATVAGLPAIVISATAGPPATQVAVNRQPADATSGEPITTQPIVSIRDAAGNVVTSSRATVTASIASGTGTLTGTRSIAAVSGVATFTNLAVTGTSAVTLRFAATGLSEATSSAFTPVPPPPLNLSVDNVHLTQATQTYAGTVPIVAGRQALARVFVKANITNSATPSVRLRTFRNGTLFREYTITAPTTFVPTAIEETILAWSWNQVIPANEVVEGMSVLAEVDPANAYVESSDTDNAFPMNGTPGALDVRQVPTMRVTFVPVTQPGVEAGNITEANKNDWLDYAMRVYPFDTVEAVIGAPLAFSQTLNGASYDNTWTSLLSQIGARRVADGPAAQNRYYYGIAKPAYQSGGTGFGSIGSPTAVGVYFASTMQPSTNRFSMTLAHEWGHNFGRRHVACGGPQNVDSNYPYDPVGSVGSHGYDLPYGVLRLATGFREFMSYCQPLWISDYTYNAVLAFRAASFIMAPSAELRRSLLIWGSIGPDGVVLEPAFEIDSPLRPAEPGPYTIQALDESGRQVFASSFAGHEVSHTDGHRTFAFAVPLPADGAVPATLRVLNGTREVARRIRNRALAAGGATTNAVASTRLLSAGASRARLEWNAVDYPMAMVRDAATGEVLAFLRGGGAEIALRGSDVDVVLSNGVTSVRQRLPVTPR